MHDITLERIRAGKLVAIVRGVGTDRILSTAQALVDGGITMLEIALDHGSPDGVERTLDSIALVNERMGEQVLLGAGTVLTPEQVDMVRRAGARYIISPDSNVPVIQRTRELGLVSIPAALTPTEVAAAHRAGADVIKLFPGGLWGVEYLKAVRAPLPHIPMMIVGGVEVDNIAGFLQAGACGAGIGSSLVNNRWVAQGEFGQITAKARLFVGQVQQAAQ